MPVYQKSLCRNLLCQIYHQQFYLNQSFSEAIFCFKKVLNIDPKDKAAENYLERAIYYDKHGVPPDWEGIESLDSK